MSFSSSLRKRREWATVPSMLLTSKHRKWKEEVVETHDIALPFLPVRHEDHREFFRFLLLSSVDVQHLTESMARIERFYNHSGGRDVGIVFLLHEKDSPDNGTGALMNLQASLLSTFEVPILPLASLSSLQQTLAVFHNQLLQSQASVTSPPINSVTALLPYCSTSGLIPEHARNVLSDICHSIRELAVAATTSNGQDTIRNWVAEPSPAVAADILSFWEQEYIVD